MHNSSTHVVEPTTTTEFGPELTRAFEELTDDVLLHAAKRDRTRKSILDFVLDDAKRLQSQLGVKDQRKLDEYMSSVREIEKRVELASKQSAEDAPSGAVRPTGIPREYVDHSRLMLDINDALAANPDEKQRAVVIRRLRAALGSDETGRQHKR